MSEPPPWEDIRRTVEAGLPMKDAAGKFGVKYETLKKRAQRERWLTDNAIRRALVVRQQAKENVPARSPKPTPESVIAQSLEENGDKIRRTALAIARTQLESVSRAGTLAIENWSDFRIATEMGLKAAGLDSNNAPPVQILITDAPARILDA